MRGGLPENPSYSVNNAGQVVGIASPTSHAFVNSGEKTTDLGTLPGGYFSQANAINDAGQVVGGAYSMSGNAFSMHAFLYSGGKMTDLSPIVGSGSSALAINASGQVAGFSNNGAFLYSGGKVTTFGSPASSAATSINASGQVVGYYRPLGSDSNHAFLYSGGKITDLGTLTMPARTCINASGQVIGTFGGHGFLYSGGKMTDLGAPPRLQQLYPHRHQGRRADRRLRRVAGRQLARLPV